MVDVIELQKDVEEAFSKMDWFFKKYKIDPVQVFVLGGVLGNMVVASANAKELKALIKYLSPQKEPEGPGIPSIR